MFYNLLIFTVTLFISMLTEARPFWTEKSAFIEGNRVYFVGVSTNAPTKEYGRKDAADNAASELRTYVQRIDLYDFLFKTQFTYEEETEKGYNVYRLMYVTMQQINQIKKQDIKKKQSFLKKQSKFKALDKKVQKQIEQIEADMYDKDQLVKQAPYGISMSQVKKLFGKPDKVAVCLNTKSYRYGGTWLMFKSDSLNCRRPARDFSPCSACY